MTIKDIDSRLSIVQELIDKSNSQHSLENVDKKFLDSYIDVRERLIEQRKYLEKW